MKAGSYTAEMPYNWTSADFLDPEVGCLSSPGNSFTQLYNLDAVAYESVIVGLFSIFTGKECGAMCTANCNTNAKLFDFSIENAEMMENCP